MLNLPSPEADKNQSSISYKDNPSLRSSKAEHINIHTPAIPSIDRTDGESFHLTMSQI